MLLIGKKIFTTFLFCLLFQINTKAQKINISEIVLTDTCYLDKPGIKSKKIITNKTGIVYERFGAIIINIKGKAYNPCNLPPNLIGKKILISGVVFENAQTDGTPIKLTYLKLLTN